jgi:hypothetical protein
VTGRACKDLVDAGRGDVPPALPLLELRRQQGGDGEEHRTEQPQDDAIIGGIYDTGN